MARKNNFDVIIYKKALDFSYNFYQSKFRKGLKLPYFTYVSSVSNLIIENNGSTAAQLQAAKEQFDRAKVGDGQPLPPPFTYGKIWVPPYNRGPVEKVPKAPSISATELKQLMKDLPKPETQLQLPAPPIGGIPVPGRPADPTTFLQLARASINQKRYAKTWRRLGKRLNARGITRATNQRQDHPRESNRSNN